MNLNKLAKRITLKEGKKVSVNIGQVKEILRLTLIELGKCENKEIIRTVNRYR